MTDKIYKYIYTKLADSIQVSSIHIWNMLAAFIFSGVATWNADCSEKSRDEGDNLILAEIESKLLLAAAPSCHY